MLIYFTNLLLIFSEFIKKLIPSQVTQINTINDWMYFQAINNNKPKALLFSSHASSLSPLYKHVSVKYSHLFNFAQVTSEKLDLTLASKFGLSARPTIVFFAENSENFRAVPVMREGSAKDSFITLLEENKYLGAPQFHNDNFLYLCGRKSTHLCGITFTTPNYKHFTKHLQSLRQLSDSDVKVGWVDSAKLSHFSSFFNITSSDSENLQNMIIWDGAKRKYTLINEEISPRTLTSWIGKKASVKYFDIPQDVPSLVEASPDGLLDLSWLVTILRFIGNNIISVMIIGAVIFRMFAK